METKISKENIALAGELFCKCVEFSGDEDVFSANLQFTSYVQWFEFNIYSHGGTGANISETCRFDDNKHISLWISEMLEILIDEKTKSDIRNSPENIEATKEKQKKESIARLEKKLAELKS